MEKTKTILILTILLIILAIFTIISINPTLTKQNTKIAITSNSTLKNG